jgi:hypothetical protein
MMTHWTVAGRNAGQWSPKQFPGSQGSTPGRQGTVPRLGHSCLRSDQRFIIFFFFFHWPLPYTQEDLVTREFTSKRRPIGQIAAWRMAFWQKEKDTQTYTDQSLLVSLCFRSIKHISVLGVSCWTPVSEHEHYFVALIAAWSHPPY